MWEANVLMQILQRIYDLKKKNYVFKCTTLMQFHNSILICQHSEYKSGV